MKRYSFLQLDVFTDRPFGGNQLAVFTDARGLTTAEMQTLTREMNYSETTFVLPPDGPGAAKRVRIFTPAMEMPMAGHPTVGTAAALAVRKEVDVPPGGGEIILQLGIGPVSVIYEPVEEGKNPFVWMKHRQPKFGDVRADRERVADALGLLPDDIRVDLPLQEVSTGVPFLFVPVRSLIEIGEARSEYAPLARLFEGCQPAHVALFTEEVVDREARVHARMFSPHLAGIPEDPATGSMAAPLGACMAHYGLLKTSRSLPLKVEQGLEMGRPSRIYVEVGHTGETTHTLRIGGHSVIVGEGEIFWD